MARHTVGGVTVICTHSALSERYLTYLLSRILLISLSVDFELNLECRRERC